MGIQPGILRVSGYRAPRAPHLARPLTVYPSIWRTDNKMTACEGSLRWPGVLIPGRGPKSTARLARMEDAHGGRFAGRDHGLSGDAPARTRRRRGDRREGERGDSGRHVEKSRRRLRERPDPGRPHPRGRRLSVPGAGRSAAHDPRRGDRAGRTVALGPLAQARMTRLLPYPA